MSKLETDLPRRSTPLPRLVLIASAAMALVTSCTPGGNSDQPKSPEVAKREIYQFLKEKSGRTDFSTPVPNDLTQSPTTDQSPTTAPERTAPPSDIPRLQATAEFRKATGQGEDWPSIYGRFGQQLNVADQLLLSATSRDRETGVIVAAEVARQGIRDGIDPWFAPRVAEAYLWPALPSVESEGWERLSVSALGNLTRFVFQRAHETNNVILNYRAVIDGTTNVTTADRARMGLVRVYESLERYEEAVSTLRSVQSSNEFLGNRMSNLLQKVPSP